MFVSLDDQLIVRNGVGVLVGLTRVLPGPLRRVSAGLLWGIAQRSSQRRASVLRAESAKTDAWTDMAMHHHTR